MIYGNYENSQKTYIILFCLKPADLTKSRDDDEASIYIHGRRFLLSIDFADRWLSCSFILGAISLVAFCRIDVCAYFPYGNLLSVDSYRIEVFENYVGGYLWLSDLDRGNDYIPIDRARPVQMDTDVSHYL